MLIEELPATGHNLGRTTPRQKEQNTIWSFKASGTKYTIWTEHHAEHDVTSESVPSNKTANQKPEQAILETETTLQRIQIHGSYQKL
jgi:hypothetical protein